MSEYSLRVRLLLIQVENTEIIESADVLHVDLSLILLLYKFSHVLLTFN